MSTAKKLHALRSDAPISPASLVDAPLPARAPRESLKEAARVEALTPAAARPEPVHGARAEQAHVQAQYQLQDRRRLSMPERLAEGRGFWRGAMVGGLLGLGLGVAGGGVTFTMWAPMIMNTVRDAILLQSVIHDGGAGSASAPGAASSALDSGSGSPGQ